MRAISNPTIKLNGATVSIVPNSLSYKLGTGDKNIRAISAGGDSVSTVVTDNVETKLSMIKFSVPNTSEGLRIARVVGQAGEQNEIQIVDQEAQISFSTMALMTEPERPLTQDGEIELEMQGPPATQTS